ncbi:MAG: Exonuclease, partial [Myxococcaceae bacterium]|nr:Exonuclease [Myxococcaceae bacterium]
IAEMCEGVDFIAAHNAPVRSQRPRRLLRARGPADATRSVRVHGTDGTPPVRYFYPTRLNIACERLGIPLTHHDAASDAEACAEIVLRALAMSESAMPAPSLRS